MKAPAWKWDKWQQRILDHQGNITVRAGRQSGKSEVIAEKAMRFSRDNPGTTIVVIAPANRQSALVFEKMRERAIADNESVFAEKPTQTRLVFTNGSKIYCVPTGRTGYSIRGFTADIIIADECPYIAEAVWPVVTPMLAVSKKTKGFGWLITIGTPFGKGGFFYETFSDPDFLHIHVSSEDCPRIDKGTLLKEKKKMTKLMYRQEYLAEFCDEWHQFFSTELLKRQATFIEWSMKEARGAFYLGVDVARYGGDENAFVVCELAGKKLRIVKCFVTDRVSTTDTIGRIIRVDRDFNFKKIFIDDAGVGGGVTDALCDKLGRSRVVGLNNASKRLQVQGEEKKRGILKEDLYSNALMLLETGMLEMIADVQLMGSLKSITFEYTDGGKVKIFGKRSHLAEALVRSVWCVKEKGLDLFIM